MSATRPLPVIPPRQAPRPTPIPGPTPVRVKGGCRSRVNGVRCSHPARAHHPVGFEGWREQCAGCPCRVYRDPWPLAVGTVVLGLLLGAAGGIGFWVLLFTLLDGGLW